MSFEPRHSDHPVSEIPDEGWVWRPILAAVIWIAAATLAVIAPFLRFISLGSGLGENGFGQLVIPGGATILGQQGQGSGVFYGGGPPGEHSARSGIALLIAALLLIVALGLALARRRRPAALALVAGALGLVGTALGVWAVLEAD